MENFRLHDAQALSEEPQVDQDRNSSQVKVDDVVETETETQVMLKILLSNYPNVR